MFTETDLNRKNRKVQNLYRTLFMLMTIILIVPVAIILATLVYKGGGIISIDFLFTDPTNGMTEGGIFPALLGTVWIVGVALIASVPLGVAAAIYLNEYAPDNGFTRIIQLAIINLAGVPLSCMPCSEWELRYLLRFWHQYPGGQFDPGCDDATGGDRLYP